jgi:hypothetical protein
MEKHERVCTYESQPMWRVEVTLDIDQEPLFRVKKMLFCTHYDKDRDKYLARDAEVRYAVADTYYFVRKFVATEAEVPAALEECKAKLREFLLHLAGEVDGLKVEQS